MTVKQVGRTTNSVTINVSGITEGNRQTLIWMPDYYPYWFTLWDAKEYGYITDIEVADVQQNNGNITVQLPDSYYKEYKVVTFCVDNLDDEDNLIQQVMISTVLKFEYEKNPDSDKISGEDIDITVNDLKAINEFGGYIAHWMCLDENGEPTHDGWHYTLDGVMSGDPIYAFYLSKPAQNILYAADFNAQYFTGTHYDAVSTNAYNVANKCVSGADFKALYFNQIKDAINSFNMSITV